MLDVADFVEAGLYGSNEDVIRDALRSLTQAHPEYRALIAVSQYRGGATSLGKAAQMAGVSQEQMKEILYARGIAPELGPADVDEAREELRSIRMSVVAGDQ